MRMFECVLLPQDLGREFPSPWSGNRRGRAATGLQNQKTEQPDGGRECLETVVQEDCKVRRDGFVDRQMER